MDLIPVGSWVCDTITYFKGVEGVVESVEIREVVIRPWVGPEPHPFYKIRLPREDTPREIAGAYLKKVH